MPNPSLYNAITTLSSTYTEDALDFVELSPQAISDVLLIEDSAHISPWSKGMFDSSFNKRSVNVGLYKSEVLVGYFIAEFIAGEMTLHNVCVAPEQQGNGYASALMQQFIAQAKHLESEDVWLEVRASNDVAIALYKKFGFEPRGVRKNYYSVPKTDEAEKADKTANQKEDAVLMCLSLKRD